jgi:hypothetical protein
VCYFKKGLLALNKALLKNPFLTAKKLKQNLGLIASKSTICGWVRRLGWRKINTKYCQIVSPVNRCKRFIFACVAKTYNDKFENSIAVDECTVELRQCKAKNWTKDNRLLRAAGNKVGKPKHNIKIHLFGGISRLGLTPLRIFTGKMNNVDVQDCFRDCLIPFGSEKFPFGYRLQMDNDPKHKSNSTKQFILLNGINHFETPPQSPVSNYSTSIDKDKFKKYKPVYFIFKTGLNADRNGLE